MDHEPRRLGQPATTLVPSLDFSAFAYAPLPQAQISLQIPSANPKLPSFQPSARTYSNSSTPLASERTSLYSSPLDGSPFLNASASSSLDDAPMIRSGSKRAGGGEYPGVARTLQRQRSSSSSGTRISAQDRSWSCSDLHQFDGGEGQHHNSCLAVQELRKSSFHKSNYRASDEGDESGERRQRGSQSVLQLLASLTEEELEDYINTPVQAMTPTCSFSSASELPTLME